MRLTSTQKKIKAGGSFIPFAMCGCSKMVPSMRKRVHTRY